MTYRVVADRSVDEALWLYHRRRLVTASDSVHLMDAADPRWALSEATLAQQKIQGGTNDPSPLMLAGSFWEPRIGEYVSAVTGLALQGSSALYVNDQRPFLGATPDGFVQASSLGPLNGLQSYLTVVWGWEVVRGEDALQSLLDALAKHGDRALVEIKNQESKRRSKWYQPEGAPKHYFAQVQHQMAVLDDYSLCLLIAKVDANELYIHPIEADEMYQELLVDTCRAFHEKWLVAS